MTTHLNVNNRQKPLAFMPTCLAVFFLLGVMEVNSAEGLSPQKLQYDPNNDVLTLQVEQVSLKTVLSRIAMLSGIEVLMDPRVEQQVSVTIQNQPLEQGLKQLVRGMNSVFRYGESGSTMGAKPLLVGLSLLPQSDADGQMLEPLLSMEGEAMLRTMTKRSQASDNRLVGQRWDQRLAQLPPAHRERIIDVAQQQRRKLELRRKIRDERQQLSALRREELLAERERGEGALRLADPERYELRRQRFLEIEKSIQYN